MRITEIRLIHVVKLADGYASHIKGKLVLLPEGVYAKEHGLLIPLGNISAMGVDGVKVTSEEDSPVVFMEHRRVPTLEALEASPSAPPKKKMQGKK